MKNVVIVVMLSALVIIVPLNAVSIREALANYLHGESNRQFWLEQSIGAIVIPGITAGVMALVPGGLLAYPPIVLAQMIGMGVAGGAGVIHNRREWIRNIVETDTNIPLQVSSAAITEQAPKILPDVTPPISSMQLLHTKPQPAVSTTGDNIFAAFIMATIAGAGYKLYQWYNAPKKDEPVEQKIEQIKKEV